MIIPFKEPLAPRYIYINPANNKVHLLVPVTGGQEISTDNTCKSTAALADFFQQGAALRELNAYKSALEFDLQWLDNDHPLAALKQERLTQINAYIAAIPAMQGQYKDAVISLLQSPSNLYSIQLRPCDPDNVSPVINPVFSLNRGVHATTGTPLSALYNALHTALPDATIAPIDPRTTLSRAVLAALPEEAVNFEAIQHALTEQCQRLFGLNVNFTQNNQETIDADLGFSTHNFYKMDERPDSMKLYVNGYFLIGDQHLIYIHDNGDEEVVPINDFKVLNNKLAEIDFAVLKINLTEINTKRPEITELNNDQLNALITSNGGHTPPPLATASDYVAALLGTCASNMWEKIPTSPFYGEQGDADKTEKFSMLTQFFLASLNVYCKANGISDTNFGTELDASSYLSDEVAEIVTSALGTGRSVEDGLCTFFNERANEFGLNRPLTDTDTNTIKQTFDRTYKTVTATKENPHMDDYMILDTQTHSGKFVTHQGSICTDFAELITAQPSNYWMRFLTPVLSIFYPSLDNTYFQAIRADFETQHDRVIQGSNEHTQVSIDVDIETFISRIKDDEQFIKLPIKTRLECMKSPSFQLRTFLNYVAKGRQDEAEMLLAGKPETQTLLTTTGSFTDYSGRTFNCTAYEYAYWAKDTHMRRMLEAQMDEGTKANMLERVEAIDRDGLTYEQHGVVVTSPGCFKFDALKTALQRYVNGYDTWLTDSNWSAMQAAWIQVGLAQRDLPVHVINEYCRLDRSFDPLPTFKEDNLPRVLTYSDFNTDKNEALFPLIVSDSSGLGVDFALLGHFSSAGVMGLPARMTREAGGPSGRASRLRDLAAVSHLDEIRTNELKQSLEILGKPMEATTILNAR